MFAAKIILAITVLIDFSLSALIFIRARRNIANRSIAGLIFFLGLWTFSVLMLYQTQSLFWGKATILSIYPTVPFFFIFTHEFPRSKKTHNMLRWWYIWIPSFLALVLFPTELLLKSQAVEVGTIVPTFGILYYPLVWFSLFLTASALWHLAHNYTHLRPVYRMQLKYVALGFFFFVLTVILTNVSLPLLEIHSFNVIGPSYALIFVGFTTYAIYKYRLVDIRLFVIRAAMYISFIVVIAALYALIFARMASFLETEMHIRKAIVYFSLGYLLIFSWPYVKEFLERITDRIFYRGRYDRQKFLKSIGDICSSALSLNDFTDSLLKVVCSEMRLGQGSLVILGRNRGQSAQVFLRGNVSEDLTQMIRGRLENQQIILADELEEDDEVKKHLRLNKIGIVVPLLSENNLVGFLALGDKRSGAPFTIEDIQVLEILEKEIVVAIQNSQFYEEIQGFNERLRLEISEATAELRVANENLQRLDKAKDEFISIASHQLRAPLTAIRGFISLAQDDEKGNRTAVKQECLEMAAHSAERLLYLVDDMLTISNIGENLKINIMEFPLEEVIQQIIKEEKPRAMEKGISLFYKEPKRLIPLVKGDPDKIRNALLNIVDNAINYTEKGEVSVEVLKEDGEIMVSIRDTGIGIAEKDLPKLFSRFARGDRAQSMIADGSGLGLYIAKKIIEAHHGQIWVKSKEGKGSTFAFTLPLN